MKNHNEFVFPRKVDVLTGEYIDDLLGTDIQIASGEKSPSSAGDLPLLHSQWSQGRNAS